MLFQPLVCEGFNARKAAQVIAYLAIKSPNKRLHIVKAIKLVYLADRESITRYGFPIIEDDRVSMKHGPVNSTTYSHACGEYDLQVSGWADYLRDRSNHEVSVKPGIKPDDCDELSDSDIECLEVVWQNFGQMGPWELRDWTHKRSNLPEWENPGESSKLIPLARIMSVLKLENPDEQAELVEDQRRIGEVFASLAVGAEK